MASGNSSPTDKFAGWESDFEERMGGCPRLRGAAATFECQMYSRYQEGDHTILLGQVMRHAQTGLAPLVMLMGQMGSVLDLARAPRPGS